MICSRRPTKSSAYATPKFLEYHVFRTYIALVYVLLRVMLICRVNFARVAFSRLTPLISHIECILPCTILNLRLVVFLADNSSCPTGKLHHPGNTYLVQLFFIWGLYPGISASLYMYICVCVCVCVCMYICMYVCM